MNIRDKRKDFFIVMIWMIIGAKIQKIIRNQE